MAITAKRRKTLIIVGVITAAVTLVAGTWLAAMQFQSSAQREAAALPPEAQPILVEITRTDLVERTTMMASAQRSDARQYVLPKSGATSVITTAGVSAGEQLHSGNVIAWVNDRPLFALKGAFPLYRDLGPGDTGEDVRMIQRALGELGYNIAADGIFGTWTATCIKDLFQSVGAQEATRDKRETQQAETSTPTGPADTPQSGTLTQAESAPAAPKKPQKETYLPASEVLIIPDLPGHVTAVPAVGTVLGDNNSSLTLAASAINLSSEIPGTIAVHLQAGRKATATHGQTTLDVAISDITSKKAEENTTNQGESNTSNGSVVSFSSIGKELPVEWVGKKDILISVDLSEPKMNVLVVPQRAISTDASGKSAILVKREKEFVQVPVKENGCLSGMCAIEALPGNEPLKEGQFVRVDR